jgi:hypothetical protein
MMSSRLLCGVVPLTVILGSIASPQACEGYSFVRLLHEIVRP